MGGDINPWSLGTGQSCSICCFQPEHSWGRERSQKHQQKLKMYLLVRAPRQKMSDCTKDKANKFEYREGDRTITIYSMLRTMSRPKSTKLVKAWHLAPQMALHSTMRWVDDASVEDYACPSIFKHDMKMRLPCGFHYWGNFLSFHDASVTTLKHISLRLFSDISSVVEFVWFPINHLDKMHLLGDYSPFKGTVFALLLSSVVRAIDFDISDERMLRTLQPPFLC